MRAKLIREGYGQKDVVRMQDIRTKADGDQEKEIRLATTQANIIQDAGKAQARAEAADEVFGSGSEIAEIFHNRAVALGGSYVRSKASKPVLAPIIAAPLKGEKIRREFKSTLSLPSEKIKFPDKPKQEQGGFTRGLDPKVAMAIGKYADAPEIGGEYHTRAASILPLGKINLGTGDCSHFNVYDTYNGIAEIWRNWEGKYKLIFTASNKPHAKLKDRQDFKHDQTWKIIGTGWEFIDYIPVKDMKELIRVYGGSMTGYTYK